jgi:pre-mRNA-processing factor 40
LFSADNRYLDVLGNPGSNPLELFWDVVDGFDQKLDAKIAVVQDALSRRQSAKGGSSSDEPALFTEQNTPALEDFIKMVREDEDEAVKALSDQEIEHVYKDVRSSPLVLFVSDHHCSCKLSLLRKRLTKSVVLNVRRDTYRRTCAML